MSEDWFGDFTLDESWTLDFAVEKSSILDTGDEDPNLFLDVGSGRDVIHKRGLALDLSYLVNVICRATDELKKITIFSVVYLWKKKYSKRCYI